MKAKLLFGLALSIAATTLSMGQTIKNGSFENWSVTAIDNPDGWITTNTEQGGNISEITIKKVTGQVGSAILLVTESTAQDTIFGFFNMTQGDPTEGEGGKPYSQKPDSITGYYKSDVKAGDTALLIVVFKKNGAVLSKDIFKFTGAKTSFTRFAFKLSLSATPDSMIIAAASSNAIDNVGVKPGSSLTIDELAFVGTGVTQTIPNGNFDNWTTDTLAKAIDWFGEGLGVSRTNDVYKGDYAMVLTTQDYGNGFVSGAGISTADFSQQGGPVGGSPYTSLNDTLVFYYKYIPNGTDTASLGVNLLKNKNIIGGSGVSLMPATAYTRVEVPILAGSAPDTLIIVFVSSNYPASQSNVGSKLYLDEVHLKSQPLNTGIFTAVKNNLGITAYPNPVADKLTIDLNNAGNINTVVVTDMLGRVITQENNVSNSLQLDTQSWPQGVYLYTVTTETGLVSSGKVIKK